MLFYVLCRYRGDSSPGPWGAGWAPALTQRLEQYDMAINLCKQYQKIFDGAWWEFSVVVAEYDAPQDKTWR